MQLFITFEGGEGSGKTTQIRLLAQALKKRGFSVLTTREPGGSSIGKEIRKLLLHNRKSPLSPLAELLLYEAERAQHVEEVIKPALKNKIVISDRFMDATLAYQGYGRGFEAKLVNQLNEIACGGLKPDLTFLLDCPPEFGLKRAQKRLKQNNSKEGRFESEKLAFHQKVRKGYLDLARRHQKRFVVVDARGEIKEIHRKILEIVEKRL